MDSPIDYPVVVIDGRRLVVKCSLYAQYLLSKEGKTIADVLQALPQPGAPAQAGAVAGVMDAFTLLVAENFSRSGEPIPTADYWASHIPDETWGECCKAVGAALVKALRPAAQAQAQAAA